MEKVEHSNIVVCVSPLSALMLDQVTKFEKRGLPTAHEDTIKRMLKSRQTYREMFRSHIYCNNLAGVVDEAYGVICLCTVSRV
jgi:hypothetical protein